jgi:hypothetical protein
VCDEHEGDDLKRYVKARVKSGSMRTWSSSARGAGRGRHGYRETSRLPLAALYPEDAARLLVAVMDVVTMRKPL